GGLWPGVGGPGGAEGRVWGVGAGRYRKGSAERGVCATGGGWNTAGGMPRGGGLRGGAGSSRRRRGPRGGRGEGRCVVAAGVTLAVQPRQGVRGSRAAG